MHRVPPVGLVDEQERCDQQVFAESADVTRRYFCCHRRRHAGEGCTAPQLLFARFAMSKYSADQEMLKLMCFALYVLKQELGARNLVNAVLRMARPGRHAPQTV